MPTALALSPHLDDVAFSCGGRWRASARRGLAHRDGDRCSPRIGAGPARASRWPASSTRGWRPEVDYMALRRAEDAAAAAALGVAAPPAAVPGGAAPRLRRRPRRCSPTPAPTTASRADLAPVLAGLIAAESPDLILAPQAIGGHVDHVQVVRALRSLAVEGPILWWRDFPYNTIRRDTPHRPFAAEMAALGEVVVELGPDVNGRMLAGLRRLYQPGRLPVRGACGTRGAPERGGRRGTVPRDGRAAGLAHAGSAALTPSGFRSVSRPSRPRRRSRL